MISLGGGNRYLRRLPPLGSGARLLGDVVEDDIYIELLRSINPIDMLFIAIRTYSILKYYVGHVENRL